MSGITIGDLPNEVTIKILRYLNQEDLHNVTLTCKLWNDLIETSCRWSLELYYDNVVDFDEPWIDFMLSTDRKFGTIKLNMLLHIKNKTLEIFRKHGLNVVRLYLVGGCIDNFVKFAEILKCMPNLGHVIILETSTLCAVSDAPPDEDLPDMKKLKTLEMVSSEYSIVKCFQRAKLTTLKVLNSNLSLDCKPLEDFIKSQEALTSIAFRSIHHESSMLFRTESLNTPMPFHLTHLSFLNVRLQKSPNDYNNLLRLLKPQARTLKVLELGRHFPSFVFKFIFANMTKLQTFSLMMTEVPTDKECLERLEENRSVTNLIFLDGAGFSDDNSQCFCDFLKKLPNVHTLHVMEYCGNVALLCMAQSLRKIEALTTYSFNDHLFHDVHFPNLKSLQIHQLDGEMDWNEFTKANAQLTELTVAEIFDETFLNSEDIGDIATNLRLQSLRLGKHFSADERFFEIMRTQCPDLKILDLHKSSVPNELTDRTDWNVLRLCDDDAIKCSKFAAFWNEDDYDGRFPYNDEDEWDVGGGVLEPFDVYFMGIDFNYLHVHHYDDNYYDEYHSSDEDS